jgi:anti-sigma-K factor RskA
VDSQVHTLAITMEPMGGSAGPTTTPMASGTLNTV